MTTFLAAFNDIDLVAGAGLSPSGFVSVPGVLAGDKLVQALCIVVSAAALANGLHIGDATALFAPFAPDTGRIVQESGGGGDRLFSQCTFLATFSRG